MGLIDLRGGDRVLTERLSIRDLCLSDQEFIVRLRSTQGWIQYIGKPDAGDDPARYMTGILSNPMVQYWVVCLKCGDVPIGIVTLVKRKHLEHPDVGFAFLPEFHRQGYALEAVSSVLTMLRACYAKLVALTRLENGRSIQLLQKLGFSRREADPPDGGGTLVFEWHSP